MEQIKITLEDIKKREVKTTEPHERSELIGKILDLVGKDKEIQKNWKLMVGRTRHLTNQELYIMYNKAKEWKTNPGALFWKLLKLSTK